MNVRSKVAVLAALLMPMAAVPASAQTWKWDWNVNGGYSFYSNMLDNDANGFTNAADGSDVKFKNGYLLGSQLTFWAGKNFAIRLNGTYSDRPLEAKDFTLSNFNNSGISDVNLWSGSGDLLFRFSSPKDEYSGMEFLPYAALGLGAKWHNPAGDNYTCVDTQENKSWNCAPFTVQNGTTAGNTFALAEANSLMGLVGLGADWRLGRSFAIRTEIGDRIYKPKLHQLATPLVTTGTTFNTLNGDETVSKTVNEIYGQIGLGFLFGIARPAAVAIVTPPPAPAPAPVPTVSREDLSVCVVDPTSTTGLRMQSAVLVGGRDTVVVVGGQDRPFATSVGTVSTAANADWYVRGQPLTVKVGNSNMEFATYGTSRVISSDDLAYLGNVNGMPVYADRNDVKDVMDELNDVRKAQAGADLGEILNQQKDLRAALDKVKVLYVPMQPSGCVFQAVQRQEEVRKGK